MKKLVNMLFLLVVFFAGLNESAAQNKQRNDHKSKADSIIKHNDSKSVKKIDTSNSNDKIPVKRPSNTNSNIPNVLDSADQYDSPQKRKLDQLKVK